MLQELCIRNLAIIDDLKIEFGEGFNVLSGETGAGKSIIINAVGLLLGGKATADLIRTGSETAQVEALFFIEPGSSVARSMAEYGYEYDEGLLIRRIISSNNRHRTYINGRLANVGLLKTITRNLASISGQHAHQGLLKEDSHLPILDRFAGLRTEREAVRKSYQTLLPLIRRLKEQKALKERQSEQLELLRFQKAEIEDAQILPDEDKTLEQELNRLKNAEMLYQVINQSIDILHDRQDAVNDRLTGICKDLDKASRIDPKLSAPLKHLTELTFQIEDITGELRSYIQTIEMDEGKLEQAAARLDLLRKLKRKYGGSLSAVQEHLEKVEAELSGVENLSETIESTRLEMEKEKEALVLLCRDLSEKRQKAALIFGEKVEAELSDLKMENTIFRVKTQALPVEDGTDPRLIDQDRRMDDTGSDRVFFQIAPNVGEALKPLWAIASGGELSRVVLALKAVMAREESVETVIFDEVDAGIGGGVAEIVGRKIAALSGYHQVICITHLPQIAKFGKRHYRIAKTVSDGRTRTLIEALDEKDRMEEIARMLGGVNLTKTTIEHAREMLDTAEF